MGNADEQVRAVAKTAAVEIDRTALGHHPLDMTAGCDNARTLGKMRSEARDRTAADRCRQREDGPPTRPRCALKEIHLPADPTKDVLTYRIGTDLPGCSVAYLSRWGR